ncbi:hypothetical protein EL79_5401 [Escherichia coli]|nr:hypothetical protein EL79_5401 [Escherichia coli]
MHGGQAVMLLCGLHRITMKTLNMLSDHCGVAYCRSTTCRMMITTGRLQPADRMTTTAFTQDGRCGVQTDVRIKCRPCGGETVPVPAQIDLSNSHVNPPGRIPCQKNLKCLPGFQATGIAVALTRHIDGPRPGTCNGRKAEIRIPFFHHTGNRRGRHHRLCQRDGIEHFCRHTMHGSHAHIPLRDIMRPRPAESADSHAQQRHCQKAATRHPSAPCCSTTGILPSPKRSQRPAS